MKRNRLLLSLGLVEQYRNENADTDQSQQRKEYRAVVWKLTEAQPLANLPNIDKRGFVNHHLDHIVSIADGFKHGFPPEWIADITNLRCIPAEDNIKKGHNSDAVALSEMIARLSFS